MRADLHLDLEAVLRSTLHPNSKLLWLYVLSRGKGKGLQQDRPDIAHAPAVNLVGEFLRIVGVGLSARDGREFAWENLVRALGTVI